MTDRKRFSASFDRWTRVRHAFTRYQKLRPHRHDGTQSVEEGISHLRALGQVSYWQQRNKRHDRKVRTSLRWQRAGARVAERRTDARISLSFLRPAAWTAVTAVALIVATELLARAMDGTAWPPLSHLTVALHPSGYETLAAAVVTAEAAFLALFYTTVGVVASTAYQDVPGDVRQLFVEERTGSVYARGVVRALVFGLAVLTADAVDYRPRALSVVVLAVLTAIAILRLMVLGTSLFNFFDPTALSQPLPARFERATTQASAPETAFDEATQQIAHANAFATLRLYHEIVALVTNRSAHDASASTTVAHDMLLLAAKYAGAKPAIPIGSQWWARTPSHPNWLTLDHNQLQMALATSTGASVTMIADPLWVERKVAATLATLLTGLAADDQLGSAVQVVDVAASLLQLLAGQLQVDAALTYQGALSATMLDAAQTSDFSSGGAIRSTSILERIAAAERSVLSLTNVWLGYVQAAHVLAAQDLTSVFDRAVAGRPALYRAGLPRALVEMFERFIDAIDTEIAADGRRITPLWWVRHHAARALTSQLRTVHDQIVAQLERATLAPARSAVDAGDHQLGAVIVFAALELFNKVDFHQGSLVEAFTAISRLRSSAAGDESSWMEPPDATAAVATLRDDAYVVLGRCLTPLRTAAHESGRPDLYGQTYQVLFETVFNYLLDGRVGQARILFPLLFIEAGAARDRLLTDLAEQDLQVRLVFGSEPLIALMELSGYALLMQELDGEGIWDDVRQLWEAWLQSDAAASVPEFLVNLISTTQMVLAISPGSLARTGRVQQLAHLLRERGVVDRSSEWMPGRAEPPAPHPSPIVSAFAPDWVGLHHDELAELFVVEFLTAHLDADASLPRNAESLAERIARYREDSEAVTEEEGHEGGNLGGTDPDEQS